MSAILPGAPNPPFSQGSSLGKDGVRRYKTLCKVLIDSHLNPGGTIEIFEDVWSVETSKTIKGAGQATIALIPSENYLNIIFPNDVVNIYFDIGDGSGWTRTFFGFVDRVEEDYTVGNDGKPRTSYKVVCSDMVKAFERTMIYFNPHMAGRPDFQNYDFAEYNIGGSSLMTRGIVAGGSPPDIIVNIILLMMGIGNQFQLPASYSPGKVQERLRKRRQDLVYGKLNPEALEALASSGQNYSRLRQKELDNAAKIVRDIGKKPDRSEQIKLFSEQVSEQDRSRIENATPKELQKLIAAERLRSKLQVSKEEKSLYATDDAAANQNFNILEATVSEKSYLIDILDIYTFVERRAIDGYLFGQPVWQKQGPLISILKSYSNETQNELFFDLRPLSSEGSSADSVSSEPVEGSYSIALDDKRGNDPAGVTYIPALVMREYPFSTIDGLDLSEVELQLKDEDSKKAAANAAGNASLQKIGKLYFGAIYSDKPGVPGRHIIKIDNINIADRAEIQSSEEKKTKQKDKAKQSTAKAVKHLDVAVVSDREITKTTLGRSDGDHFNLFEFYSDAVLGTDQRFYMRDMLPIITPIHILRNGLRVHSVTTRAARYSIEAIKNWDVTQTKDPEEGTATSELYPLVTKGNVEEPVNSLLAKYYDNIEQGNWGYRPKSDAQAPDKTGPKGAWVFHQGIDINKKKNISPLPDEPIPIKAIANGSVVVSAPDGCYDGYGNVIVIKHNFEEIGFRYSVYGHLSAFEDKFNYLKRIKKGNIRNKKNFCALNEVTGISKGRQKPIPVNRGDIIGYMGNTGFKAKPGERFHLHFEIDRHFPPRNDAVTQRISFNDTPRTASTPAAPAGFDPSGVNTTQMKNVDQRSANPMEFFQWHGYNLQDLINDFDNTVEEVQDGEPEDTDMGGNLPEEIVNKPTADAFSEAGKEEPQDPTSTTSDTGSVVDSASTRTQIIRWALLQDHWYQHNLEYLSGVVSMRGAPEIRVGYRLDLSDRNMSCYVEGVNHSWQFPNNMKTSLKVTRGQPNNPYPVYVLPSYPQMGATETQRRTASSRLATYFVTPDPVAIRRSLFIKNNNTTDAGLFVSDSMPAFTSRNFTDDIEAIEYDEQKRRSKKYDEAVIPAGAPVDLRTDEPTGGEDATDNSRLDSVSQTDSRGVDKNDALGKN